MKLTAKEVKKLIELVMKKVPETGRLCLRYDHYKVLGLPSDGKNYITDKQISEAFETLFSQTTSNLTLEELIERLVRRTKKGNHESGSAPPEILLISYYVLMEEREHYDSYLEFAKCLERVGSIDREKEKLAEYELMSHDYLQCLLKSFPWVIGGLVITLPVVLPASICWKIGRFSYKAIQSAVSWRSGTGECSSGGQDIQDWELVNEDDCVNNQLHQD